MGSSSHQVAMEVDEPVAVEVGPFPPPPILPAVLANAIQPVPYNRANFADPGSTTMPPTNRQVAEAAQRIPHSQEVEDAMASWRDWLDARDDWRRRAQQAEADAAANAAAAAVVAQAESERLERDKKFLGTYSSPLESTRALVKIGEMFDSDMHNWQAKSAGQLSAAVAEGHAKALAKHANEPNVCSGKPGCPCTSGIPGAACTCTTEDKLIKHFHTEVARAFRVWVTQGGGKTLVECLLPLLMSYNLQMETCPPELKTRDIFIISAPETVLIEQLRGEGLGVTDRALLETMPMYTKTGINLDVLIAYNSHVHFLPEKETAEDFDWPSLRDRFNVIVGGIQKWGKIFALNATKPQGERIEPEDIRSLIGDESHLGTGWKKTPWAKCDKDASWGRLIQDCHKATVFKFSGSLKKEEEKLPIKVECKACELIEKGLLCAPRINTWGFEGLQRSADGSPYEKDKLDDDDARELRLGPVNFRLAGADIASEMLADRKGEGEFAYGLSVTGMVRVTGKRAYDGATPSPTFVADHLNEVFKALPACKLTGRKLCAYAVVGDELSGIEEQHIRNLSRWGLGFDFLVVEDKFTLGFSEISKKHTWNLRKVMDTPESKEAHKQFQHRANRPVLDPPTNVPEAKSVVKRGLRIAALFHVGCGQCKDYGQFLTDRKMKEMYTRCCQPRGSPDGLCRLCYDRVNARANQYLARLSVIGARQANGNFRRQYYDIHELEINCMMGSFVNESIMDWARKNECESYMSRVTRPLLQQHQESVLAVIQNHRTLTEHHQALARQAEAEAAAAKAQEAAEAAHRAVAESFRKKELEERLRAQNASSADDDDDDNDGDASSDSDSDNFGWHDSESGSSHDDDDDDDSDNESVANAIHAAANDVGSGAEDADDDFDPSLEQEGEAGAELRRRCPSRRAANRAQRAIERTRQQEATEAALQQRMREIEEEREARAAKEAEGIAAEVLAAQAAAREAGQAAIDAHEAAVNAADEATRQQIAEAQQQMEERRQQLAVQREAQERAEAEIQARLENERRVAAEAARFANERMRSVNGVVPKQKLLQDEHGDLDIEFTLGTVPLVGTTLMLVATKHGSDLGSSAGQPTNYTSTKWKVVTELGPCVTDSDGDAIVRSMPASLLDSRNAQTGERGSFCILALPPDHQRAAPEKITFGDITYKTSRFKIDLEALKQDIVDREAAGQQSDEDDGVVSMEEDEDNTSPPDVRGEPWPVVAPPVPVAPLPPVAPLATVAPVTGAPIIPSGLSIRELAEGRVWAPPEDRPSDADPARGIPETRKAFTLKSWLMGLGLTVQHPDALLACLAMDIANVDNDKRRRDNWHTRQFSRAWASKHGIARLYYRILESYIELEHSNSPEAVGFRAALESVHHYPERYQCNPAMKWEPSAANARALRGSAPAANAPVYLTAEALLSRHAAGWALIHEALARLERNQQQTGGAGNIQLPDVVPGVKGKLPRKRELVEPEARNDGGLRFKKHVIAPMPRLPRVNATTSQNVEGDQGSEEGDQESEEDNREDEEEEDQEGDWDHSAMEAIKAAGREIIRAIQTCHIEPNQDEGVAYARNTFNSRKDMRTHVTAIKNMFHINDKAGASWNPDWPIKSVAAFPNNDAEIASHFAARFKKLSPEASKGQVANARDSMRWACRGLAISKDLLKTGVASPGVEYCRLRSAIRAKQIDLRNAELLEAMRDGVAGDGVGPEGKDDKNWMMYIRHKFEERVGALDAYCVKMGI